MRLIVRDLTSAESAKLSQWLRSSRNGIQMRRAQIISFSGQGMRVQGIASHLGMNEEYLRELIRNFNDVGFEALRQKPRPGRPSKLTEEEESLVAEIATAPPQALGCPFNQWSLRKLRDCLVKKKLVKPVSHNVIRRVLRSRKITFQRTRTWKRSDDPAYASKKNASNHSTRRPRKDRP